MMLSPSAARMSFTSSKHLYRRNARRFSSVVTAMTSSAISRRSPALGKSRLSYAPVVGHVLSDHMSRWKSTMASQQEEEYSDEDEEIDRTQGHAEAAMARAQNMHPHDESWMINLGRDGDNEWLLGPRDADHWFTGLKPTVCPGKIYDIFLVVVVLRDIQWMD
jgi:hypothetical protein